MTIYCLKQACNQLSIDKRKGVARANGFRKFYNTELIWSKVSPVVKEMLLGHRTGLEDPASPKSYYNNEYRLQRKVEQLSKEQNEIEVMRLKHEQELKSLNNRLAAQEQAKQNDMAQLKKYQVMIEEFKEQLRKEFHESLSNSVSKEVRKEFREMEKIAFNK